MKKWGVFILYLSIGGLFVQLLLVSPQDLNQEDASHQWLGQEGAKSSLQASQVMKNVHLLEARQDGRDWDLRAEKAVAFQDTANWLIEGVNAQFFGMQGASFRVLGQRGEVLVGTRDLVIEGKVQVISANGYIFATNQIYYDAQLRQLLAPSQVKVRHRRHKHQMYLQANKMKITLDTGDINMQGDVRGRKKIEQGLIRIESQIAELKSGSSQAIFEKKVQIKKAAMKITGRKALFEMAPESRDIQRITITGGIRVSDADKAATASQVVFDIPADRIVFTGQPRFVQGSDILRGEKIIFLNGGQKVKVFKGRGEFTGKERNG